ncbi:MAG: ABC transporter substrate-binding protein [Acidithiobacillus caldus]|uniref:ABC transporter substrate-binding protein n=1 Tax=Acidithiobacillus caldus TaxID=33059 RepID=UPI001C06736F|nr:ABC transporter substrate-binding protein [Acidithiobacillus caldus]MBU2790595.1 hypothetical protein [Acidithiobacillus caldus]MBU2819947.1 hypothetical protein [Acidithiobacillus caldus]WMT46632.1 MAG: ABC transporter substrate-binding protein [Acidithiobacillus caldus]
MGSHRQTRSRWRDFRSVQSIRDQKLLHSKRHTLDYVLMRDPNHSWQIVNVVADGVSDLSLKRGEYAAEFAKGGFPRLVTKMR